MLKPPSHLHLELIYTDADDYINRKWRLEAVRISDDLPM